MGTKDKLPSINNSEQDSSKHAKSINNFNPRRNMNGINLKANGLFKKGHMKSHAKPLKGISLYNMFRFHREKKPPTNEYFYDNTMGKIKDDPPSKKFTLDSDVDEYTTYHGRFNF